MPPGLIRSDPAGPGLTRRRRGRGFGYLDVGGVSISDAAEIARIKALVIPPAWQDVWICPDPTGHIQAVGTDAAGRRQYLYHEEWRTARDTAKYDRVRGLGRRMPKVRPMIAERLAVPGLGRERVLAGALRMLDLGVFRAGGEQYAPGEDDDEGTFGLATLRREHVRLRRGAVEVSYLAKGAIERTVALRDPALHRMVNGLLRRRGGGEDLLAYRNGSSWHDVTADDLNVAVKEVIGKQYTAKDLRTWNATVLAAVTLAGAAAEGIPTSQRARARVVNAAISEVAAHLGNTPTVARASYVDPRVITRFEDGRTLLPTLRRRRLADPLDDAGRAVLDRAVLRLLKD
jgi:DNA topoisomerase-1